MQVKRTHLMPLPSARALGFLTAMVSIWTASPLLAQASAAGNTADQSGANAPIETIEVFGTRNDTLSLSKVSTAGSRLNLTPLETPATVSLISGDVIRDLGVGSISDAKTMLPGISSFDTPGNGGQSFANRGFYGDNSVKQLYDGIEIYNSGSTLTFPFDSWNVDHIEALSGPASVLYGTGAIGGAINVVPKRPEPLMASTQIELAGGSFNTFHEALDTTGPIAGTKLSYRLDVSHYSSDGYVKDTPSNSIAASASVRWDVEDNLHFVLADDYGNQNLSPYQGTPTLNNQPVLALRYINYDVTDVILNFVDNWTTLIGEWTPSDDITVRNDFFYLLHHRRYHDMYGYQYVPANQTVKLTNFRDISADENQYGDTGYVKYESSIFGGLKNSALIGISLNDSTYNRKDNSNVSTGAYPGTATISALSNDPLSLSQGLGFVPYFQKYVTNVQQYGFYAEDRLSLTERLSVVGGVRTDHYDINRVDDVVRVRTNSSYQATGYNIGVVYNPVPDVSVYGQYAVASDPVSSLTSISAAQQLFSLSHGTQGEVGIKASLLDHRLEGTLAAYTITKTNLTAPSPSNPAVTVQVGQQSSHGLEASLNYRPNDAWGIAANGAILKAQYDNFTTTVSGKVVSLRGYQPVDVPEQTANARVLWNFLPDFQARAVYQYVGKRFIDATDTTPIPGYFVVNLGLSWTATPTLKFDVRVNNVTDKVYGLATSPTTQWILGAPRNVTFAANYAF